MSRLLLVSCLFVLVACFAGVDGFFFNLLNGLGNNGNNNNNNRATVCQIQANANNCNVNGPRVCARQGQSNQCTLFQNGCSFQYANCVNNVALNQVNLQLCANLAVSTRGRCANINNVQVVNNGQNLNNGQFVNNGQNVIPLNGK